MGPSAAPPEAAAAIVDAPQDSHADIAAQLNNLTECTSQSANDLRYSDAKKKQFFSDRVFFLRKKQVFFSNCITTQVASYVD